MQPVLGAEAESVWHEQIIFAHEMWVCGNKAKVKRTGAEQVGNVARSLFGCSNIFLFSWYDKGSPGHCRSWYRLWGLGLHMCMLA